MPSLFRIASFVSLSGGLLAGCAPAPAPVAVAAGPCVEKEAINPRSPLPYSEAVKGGGLVHFAGKVGATDETRAMTEGRIEAETRNVMESFRTAFEAAGVTFDDVVNATVFLADIADYDGMNGVYGEYFPANPPARATLAVRDIPSGAAVEISFVAVCR